MNIQHEPLFDTATIEKTYTEKDGVEVKYVCTSATNGGTLATDVFYRATPHPEFGITTLDCIAILMLIMQQL